MEQTARQRPGVQQQRPAGGYLIVVRDASGRPRFERVDDLAAYRSRLLSQGSQAESSSHQVSIDELAALLDD